MKILIKCFSQRNVLFCLKQIKRCPGRERKALGSEDSSSHSHESVGSPGDPRGAAISPRAAQPLGKPCPLRVLSGTGCQSTKKRDMELSR